MLKQKRIWIPILSVLVIAMGCGLFYGHKVTNQEPVTTITPASVEQPAAPKPPPPGESYETGHWHGDEWHANDAHAPVEVATPEAQGGQIAHPVNAQPPTLTQEELEIMQMTSEEVYEALYEELNKLEKGSEAYKEFADKIKWFEKNRELSDRRIQAAEKLGAALEEAARVSETEEQLKKEMRRILTEMEPEMLEAEKLYQEHQKSNPLEQ